MHRPASFLSTLRLLVSALAFAILPPSIALAAWAPKGNPVGAADGVQSAPAAIGDGSSGVIVAWLDARPTTPGIYAQRMLADGTAAWSLNGVLVSGSTPAGAPRVMSDAAGGALIVWITGSGIFAQRVDADGAIHSGWPADGKLITTDFTTTSGFAAVSDGAGGAYITRQKVVVDFFTSSSVRLTRIDADGNIAAGWTAAGVLLMSSESTALLELEADAAGGVLSGFNWWYETGTNPHRGYVERRLSNGTVPYSTEPPNPLAGLASDGIFQNAAASDGSGGSYWTYHARAAGNDSYFGMHLSSAGTNLWPALHPVPFSELTIQAGTAGVWLAGRPPGTQRLEVHRRDPGGALPGGWTAAGVVVTQPSALGVVAASPLWTELLLCWSENTSGAGFDIRALSVAQDGTIPSGWNPGGTLVCNAVGTQQAPILVVEDGGAIACWEDQRPGTGSQNIYAARIEIPGSVGVGPVPAPGFGIAGVTPVPARDRVTVQFARSGDAPVLLEVTDVQGRSLLRREVSGDATRQEFGLAGFANGVYFVQVSQAGRSATARFSVVR